MSVWTHVAAVFRYDSIAAEFCDVVDVETQWGKRKRHVPNWDLVFGKATFEPDDITDDEQIGKWLKSVDDAYDNRGEYLPFGSEGSLQISVWTNPDGSSAAKYTISIFGDLRDYDSVDEIEKWFQRSCKRGSLRQAACHCEIEGFCERTWGSGWTYYE